MSGRLQIHAMSAGCRTRVVATSSSNRARSRTLPSIETTFSILSSQAAQGKALSPKSRWRDFFSSRRKPRMARKSAAQLRASLKPSCNCADVGPLIDRRFGNRGSPLTMLARIVPLSHRRCTCWRKSAGVVQFLVAFMHLYVVADIPVCIAFFPVFLNSQVAQL